MQGQDKDFYIPAAAIQASSGQESETAIPIVVRPKSQDEESTSESCSEEPRIGKYTKSERQERIRKYKAKLNRWRQSKRNPKYKNRSKIAQNKLRINGRFVKASHISDDFSDLCQKPVESSGSRDEHDYNGLVSAL